MSLLDLFRKAPVETKSLSAPDQWLLDLFCATPAASGVSVTPRSAMRCAPVRCAVQSIAETIGQLPVHVYQRNGDGSKERAPDHPAYALLHDAANDWTPASKFREEVTRDALLYPNGGFAFINRVDGKPVELIRLDPEASPVTVDTDNGEPIYRITGSGQGPRTIPREDIIHIPSPSLSGSGLVHDGREAIGLAIVLERHAANLFGRGARPSGILTFKNTLTPDTIKKINEAWNAVHGGANSGGTAVLGSDGAFQSLTMNSVDAQFLELRKFAIEEIARIYRVPPILLQEYGRATWGNSEEMGRQFLTYSLLPWIKRWEGELLLKLFGADERKQYLASFLTDDLLRGDFAARMNGYSVAIAARILSPNEARAAENRPPYLGGDTFENPHTSSGAANV